MKLQCNISTWIGLYFVISTSSFSTAFVSRELRDGSSARDEVLTKLSEFCGKNLLAPLNETEEDAPDDGPQHWDFYNSFFFAITVVSTIDYVPAISGFHCISGYGNLAPTTTGSRMFCIAYALIGIPLNGILLAGLGEYFSRTFLRAHHRYREAPEVESRFALLLKVGQYLAAGICIFILLPAVVFAVAENWSYEESVYYAFITLSTIGFGDYVAGYMTTYDTWKQAPSLLAVYRTFIVLWIVFGLGYLAMILSFITRAMRSSRIRRLEQRVAKRFKSTHARLWHGASRDLRYLRRVLNELYMLKFKPVYRARPSLAPVPLRGRSLSLPVLLPSAVHEAPEGLTKRSMSEACLDMIDRSATFAAAPRRVDTSELLATVVDALVASAAASEADMEEEEEDLGYHGFADAEILATEEQHPPRSRASSIAPSLRSRLRSRAGSIASHLGGGDHRAPRSRG
ncbi:hypothetical protein B566_EDAN001452 [Ephemera danica]|nr:hypothetical protein B566_EDAN001452 [Ephemera danica]